jgi:hypothetical protein
MAINFPSSPTLNQVFTSGGTSWQWDGSKWNIYDGSDLVTTSYLSTALDSYASKTSPSISNPTITGTAAIAAANVTGNLTVDSNVLYVSSAANSVGINYTSTDSSNSLVLGSVDTVEEGGQLAFSRAYDNSIYWYVDTYGSGSSPSLRIVNAGDAGAPIKMNIDSAGRMTRAYQPLFSARGGTNPGTSGSPIVYGTIDLNVGSHYNSSNGRFTAPVSGYYFFSFHGLLGNANVSDSRLAIAKNGVAQYGLRFILDKYDASWNTIQGFGILSLSANDYVQIILDVATQMHTDGGYDGFMGYLLG